MKVLSFILKAIVVIYLVIFSVANTENTAVNLFFNDVVLELPMFLFVIGLLSLGGILGMLSQVSEKWKLRREISRLKTSLNKSSAEFVKLKNLTISEEVPSQQVTSGEENSIVKKQIR